MPVTQRRFGRSTAKKIVEINPSRNDKACDGQLLDDIVQQSEHFTSPNVSNFCNRFLSSFYCAHIKPTFLPTFASEFTAKYSINRSILVNINWIGVWHVARVCRPGLNVNRAKILWKFFTKSFPLCVRICYIDGLQPKKVLFYLKSLKRWPIRFIYVESHGLTSETTLLPDMKFDFFFINFA